MESENIKEIDKKLDELNRALETEMPDEELVKVMGERASLMVERVKWAKLFKEH